MAPLLNMKPSAVAFDELPEPSSTKASRDAFAVSVDDATINSTRRHLSRLISQDRIVSKDQRAPLSVCTPPHPNPLDDPIIRHNHVAALRLEADLYPLRLILSRLMTHPTHNRKGIFNQPVDPIALGLPDYDQIVKRPMDLGTVKRRLHAVLYRSRVEAIQDIRLVFVNAIRYNSHVNPVHVSAKELLSFFDSRVQNLLPAVSGTTASMVDSKAGSEGVSPVSSKVETATSLKISSCFCDSSFLPRDSANLSRVVGPTGDRAISHTYLTSDFESSSSGMPTPKTVQAKSCLRFPNRRASSTKPRYPHLCEQCYGRTCLVCVQGCLQHEPALLVCCGAQCAGSKIRKGAVYFTTTDGSYHVCDRCIGGLPATLPPYMQSDLCRYKQDLLKRRNDEEIAEAWITCCACGGGVHLICALHNEYVHDELRYECPDCRSSGEVINLDKPVVGKGNPPSDELYSFVSGLQDPVPLREMRNDYNKSLDSSSLEECPISKFIQEKVQDVMLNAINAGKTVSVRVISDCDRHFFVPSPVRRYFRMVHHPSTDLVLPPKVVQYRQKAIVVFQKIDGLDVCVFCMYVHEYDGALENKRVYIAYIDSVEHFRPRELRTQVYQEILVAYLATARERGFEKAHIWACPPSRGSCFVFWNHPVSQRVPTSERLQLWYHNALNRGIDAGVVVDVKSLYESDFERQLAVLSQTGEERMLCPPLIDGDFWIEEAVRLYQAAIDQNLKARSPTEVCVWNVGNMSRKSLCPALQVASLIKQRIMTHPLSVPFVRPVNAAALKLKDYHKIIQKPMDLGTIYARCILGEYVELKDVVNDVILMVTNAKKFNPPGNIVHSMATDVLNLFNSELNALTQAWNATSDGSSWQAHDTMSMSLDTLLESYLRETSPEQVLDKTVIVIEDDRSADGSRSISSSVASETSSIEIAARVYDDEKKTFEAYQDVETDMVQPMNFLDLHSDGPEAVRQRMVGTDVWLLSKRNSSLPKPYVNQSNKRRRLYTARRLNEGQALAKRRRQSWLCEEVCSSVRKLRSSFFTCTLIPKVELSEIEAHKLRAYKGYVASFDWGAEVRGRVKSSMADSRSALLELSQFRNFEFDTLRRAKYSTHMLLYHIHHANAPGGVPSCTSCGETIRDVRWHKVKRIHGIKLSCIPSKQKVSPSPTTNISSCAKRVDLCFSCYESTGRQSEEAFIPIPVTSKL
jgi:hypothetical protein